MLWRESEVLIGQPWSRLASIANSLCTDALATHQEKPGWSAMDTSRNQNWTALYAQKYSLSTHPCRQCRAAHRGRPGHSSISTCTRRSFWSSNRRCASRPNRSRSARTKKRLAQSPERAIPTQRRSVPSVKVVTWTSRFPSWSKYCCDLVRKSPKLGLIHQRLAQLPDREMPSHLRAPPSSHVVTWINRRPWSWNSACASAEKLARSFLMISRFPQSPPREMPIQFRRPPSTYDET